MLLDRPRFRPATGAAFEVDRFVNNSGLVGLGGHQVPAAEILGGRQVGIRIDAETLSFFDLSSRRGGGRFSYRPSATARRSSLSFAPAGHPALQPWLLP
ncbi:hypothetical protein [Streptomyces sp. NPDC057301]|uniref:hypothetical protein n=1 Tax=Streptomyces sp. NPDC057301 TaxID=3346093 RepID=UPI00363FEC3D